MDRREPWRESLRITGDAELVEAGRPASTQVARWTLDDLRQRGFTDPQAQLLVTWWLDEELRNGGFAHYYANLGGDALLAGADAVAALRAIGARDHADIAAEAILALGPGLATPPAIPGPPSDPALLAAMDQGREALRAHLAKEKLRVETLLAMGPGGLQALVGGETERAAARVAEREFQERISAPFRPLEARWYALHPPGLTPRWAAWIRDHEDAFFRKLPPRSPLPRHLVTVQCTMEAPRQALRVEPLLAPDPRWPGPVSVELRRPDGSRQRATGRVRREILLQLGSPMPEEVWALLLDVAEEAVPPSTEVWEAQE